MEKLGVLSDEVEESPEGLKKLAADNSPLDRAPVRTCKETKEQIKEALRIERELAVLLRTFAVE